MNKASELAPRLAAVEIHNVELALRSLERIIEAWNKGLHHLEQDKLAKLALVDAVRYCERARAELLDAGYNNLAYQFDHMGNLCGQALIRVNRYAGIGGALNLSFSKIEERLDNWLKPFPRVA